MFIYVLQEVESNPYCTLPMSDTKSPPASPMVVAPSPNIQSDSEPVYDEATHLGVSIPPTCDKVEYSDLKGTQNKSVCISVLCRYLPLPILHNIHAGFNLYFSGQFRP